MATLSKDLISRKSNYKVVSKKNARIVVQWMTLVRAAAERTLKIPPASPFLATALGSPAPSSSGLAGSVTAADGSLLLS